MHSGQMLMELFGVEGTRDRTDTDEWIAATLTESTTGKVRLMESICGVDNRRKARQRVERNKGAPGVDGVKTRELSGMLNRCWSSIRQSLLEGTYEPLPVLRKSIPKPGGGSRDLGIPTVQDRLVQQMMTQVLTRIYDHTFSESSFGYREGRSPADAVEQARKYAQKGAEFVVSIDLSKFFDRVNHDRLMSRLARRIKDKRVLKLIRAFLNSGILMEDDAITYPGEGTPQGGPLSPLLSNIVLDELDKELEKRGLSFVRYADDIAIFVRSPVAGERVKKSVIRFLANRMKLNVNEEKSGVDRVENMKFLGFAINARGWVARPFIHPDALKRFKVKVREITRRTRGANVHVVIRELNRFVPAWTNYYRIGLRYKLIKQLNSWIVRRLRAYLWKQWKLPRTKVRNLMSRGVYRRSALWTGCSRKGAWRMSRHPSVRTALPASRFIKEYGLLPIRKKLPA